MRESDTHLIIRTVDRFGSPLAPRYNCRMTHSPADDPNHLRPILARFADDGPRLILADMLDESPRAIDHARAELIRVQIALARLPNDHPRWAELSHVEQTLLEQHQDEWTAPFHALADGLGFRRGLLDSVCMDARAFLERGDELFRRLPVRRVRLSGVHPVLSRLVSSPLLEAIHELDLCGCELGDGGIRYLLQSQYLVNVRVLDLSMAHVSDRGVRAVSETDNLPRLRKLILAENERISGEGLAALAESGRMAGLTGLDVSGNRVDDVGIRAIVNSPHLTRLRRFPIESNVIGDAGIQALATSALLTRMLRHHPYLSLARNQIGPDGVAALAASPLAEALTRLDMGSNYLADTGLATIGFAPHFIRLRKLAVHGNQITDDGAIALAHSPLMPRLLSLDITMNQITRKGLDALLAKRPSWKVDIAATGNYASDDPFPESGVPFRDSVLLSAGTVRRILRRTVPPAFLDQADQLRD